MIQSSRGSPPPFLFKGANPLLVKMLWAPCARCFPIYWACDTQRRHCIARCHCSVLAHCNRKVTQIRLGLSALWRRLGASSGRESVRSQQNGGETCPRRSVPRLLGRAQGPAVTFARISCSLGKIVKIVTNSWKRRHGALCVGCSAPPSPPSRTWQLVNKQLLMIA